MRSIGFREAAARLPTDQISAIATRSEDYGGFGRKMGDMASARSHLGGVQFAQVAVDTETGIVRVERIVAVHDCGRPINPLQTESQIHGGILQGISYALYERARPRPADGPCLNANLEQYKILRSRELPAIEVVILENYQGMSSTDAYGVAEPAIIPTAPAVANAVYNAVGRADARTSDDAGQRPRRPRPDSARRVTSMKPFEWTNSADARAGARRCARRRRPQAC